jgi:hypothetical protein
MPGPVHCPFCQRDISFLGPAFSPDPPSPYEMSRPPYPGTPIAEIRGPIQSDVPSEAGEVYDRGYQDVCWKKMRERAALLVAADPNVIIDRAIETRRPNRQDGSIVVHVMFDKRIVPVGDVLWSDMRLRTGTTAPPTSTLQEEKLVAMGYVVTTGPNDKRGIKTVDDCPIGPLYDILMYWVAGTPENTHYKRWHMGKPIVVSPRRNACPEFMDENMVAFTAFYDDGEKIRDSLVQLSQYCVNGIPTRGGLIPPVGALRAIMLA